MTTASTDKNSKIHDMTAQFVADVTREIEATAAASIQAKLAELFGGDVPVARTSVAATKAATNGDKRAYTRKRCPFPGCKDVGSPRWSHFCLTHGPELAAKGPEEFNKLKQQYHGQAQMPGGVWYQEARTKRPRKAASAAAA